VAAVAPDLLADAALLEAQAVRRQAAGFQRIADAQRAALFEQFASLRQSAGASVGLAAEFERRVADLTDFTEGLADRCEKLGRLVVLRGGVQLQGTSDGGVVVTVFEGATDNAALIRTVAFTPEEIMASLFPPPPPRVEPAEPPTPQPDVIAAVAPAPQAEAEPAPPPPIVAAAPRGVFVRLREALGSRFGQGGV
jgi:hypothetical protein